MKLNQIKSNSKKKNPKRVGRGTGSGCGKTSTRGHKGAGQRKGSMHYIGLEGGNIPLFRKIPKRGFNALREKNFQIVNLSDIVLKLKEAQQIDPVKLKQVSLIRNSKKPVKILADGAKNLDKKLTIKADKFSKKAKAAIEKAGGKAECLQR